mgnify:CR=1 FL=1
MKKITYSVTEKFPAPIPVDEAREVLEALGFDPEDIMWRKKYISLRAGAPQRGRICYLTFKQYMKLAKKAGLTHSSEVGVGMEKYQMSRHKDKGDYEWGNCEFLTMEENLRAKHLNGGYEAVSVYRAKAFSLTSPKGKIYKGTNLQKFARKHDLLPDKLTAVCRGARNHHKGWTGVYT